MSRQRIQPPRALLIVAAGLLVVALLAGPITAALIPAEELGRYVLVTGIPFLATFVALLLGFIYLIFVLAARLNGRIPQRVYRPVEMVIIAGIVLSVIGMFQPFTILAYQIGFHTLLISTLAFIVWSHITPRGELRDMEPGPLSIDDDMIVPEDHTSKEIF